MKCICKPNCREDLNGFCIKCSENLYHNKQEKSILEQIEDIQRLAERIML